MLTVSEPIVEEIKIDDQKLETYTAMLAEYDIQAAELLPTKNRQRVSFDIHGGYTELANGIRRTLIEEIPVQCLDVQEADIETNDEFIMLHMLIRNINMIAVNQSKIPLDVRNMRLNFQNQTPEIVMITAADITGGQSVITHKNVPIINIRPGKYLRIGNFTEITGMGKDSMCKFSFLNNVSYSIRGVEPYNNFTKKGKRSIEYDPDTFSIAYETCGNCAPLYPLKLAAESLEARMQKIADILDGKDPGMQLTVTNTESYTMYQIAGFYLTESCLIAKLCFRLDPQIQFITGSVARFDSQMAIIKIVHPQHLDLIKRAVQQALADIRQVGRVAAE